MESTGLRIILALVMAAVIICALIWGITQREHKTSFEDSKFVYGGGFIYEKEGRHTLRNTCGYAA